ncbi:unnamed protein product [Somion occarium]|uniref:Uncharacterized protein n=1 Tax=Somion occarium TaxID=3059160 RepID=A0ABP1DTQ8_9APHY
MILPESTVSRSWTTYTVPAYPTLHFVTLAINRLIVDDPVCYPISAFLFCLLTYISYGELFGCWVLFSPYRFVVGYFELAIAIVQSKLEVSDLRVRNTSTLA